MTEHVVDQCKDLLNNVSILQGNALVEKVIPHLISDQANNLLTMLPLQEEIYNATFRLNRDNASGLDEFGSLFYHTYWEVIKEDVIRSTLQSFKDG